MTPPGTPALLLWLEQQRQFYLNAAANAVFEGQRRSERVFKRHARMCAHIAKRLQGAKVEGLETRKTA